MQAAAAAAPVDALLTATSNGFRQWRGLVSGYLEPERLQALVQAGFLRGCQTEFAAAARRHFAAEQQQQQQPRRRVVCFAQLAVGAGKSTIIGMLAAGLLRASQRGGALTRTLVLVPTDGARSNVMAHLFGPVPPHASILVRHLGLPEARVGELLERVIVYRRGHATEEAYKRAWVRRQVERLPFPFLFFFFVQPPLPLLLASV